MPRLSDERLHNQKRVKDFRRKLRRELTSAEAALWKLLKNSRLEGRKFRRQHSVGNYVLDFYCPAERLAVELDGEVHFDALAEVHDAKRRRFLIDNGIKVIRFENRLVFEETNYVLERIVERFGWWKQQE
ncbi:MAG: DUF559 domain-containing protein [Pyrinomonadaceae bacterium]